MIVIRIYQNYHKHTYDSNIFTPDSSTSLEEYAKRCVELGHTVLTSMEHGFQGRYYDTYEVAKEYGLKFVFGTEAYWVKDRHEKDRTNNHICIFARNESGRRQINSILSDANIDGYYYRPRLDLELIFSLEPEDVLITTACVAFWHYDNIEDIVVELHNHFGDSFMLEVQYHNTDKQKNLNSRISKLSQKHNISLIMGCDSHYIYPEQWEDREHILEAKGVKYPEEDGWYMDYPDGDIAFERFKVQGVLKDEQIKEAMDNTNIFLSFEDIEFNKDIKLPILPEHQHLTQDERNIKYVRLVAKEWEREKGNIPESLHKHYEDEIAEEIRVVTGTNMSDYFLINNRLVKEAVSNGGVITRSGRGSAASYYTNTLLGFSNIDRISAPVKLYPERFISRSRILETRSLPDLDLNCGNPEVFAEAQEKILGKGHAYPMIAFGTFRAKSAWQMYAKANDIDFEVALRVSNQIDRYETELTYASEDDKDLVDLYDYVDKDYHKLVSESEKYQGITSDRKPHPCGYLIYDGNIKEEIGLIMCRSESTKKETLTTVLDGDTAERYKFLKNDLLKVDVVLLVDKIYERIGIEHHTIRELSELIEGNDKVWNIYADGLTLGVNQVEKESTAQKAMRYKPENISELTAFIAAIRPSFQSIYSKFEAREDFEYGIPVFDELIQTPEMPNSWILYQEQIMNTLQYAGFPVDETYGILKAIAGKKPKVIAKLKDRFIDGFSCKIAESDNLLPEDAKRMSDSVWTIIENSSQYGFNASHAYSYAFDSAYCAFLKSHYPLEFYEVMMEEYSKKGDKDKVMELKKEMKLGFGISTGEIRFGLDNRGFRLDREKNQINESILSLKFLNYKASEQLYELSQDRQYECFVDLMVDIKEKTVVNTRQLNILASIDYFKDFAGGRKVMRFIDIFNEFYGGKQISQKKMQDCGIIESDMIRFSRISDSGKTFMDFQDISFLKYYFDKMEDEPFTILDRVRNEIEHMGYTSVINEDMHKDIAVITEIDVNRWGTRFLTVYRLNTGDYEDLKVTRRVFEANPIEEFEFIKTTLIENKYKKRKVNDEWIELDETELILTKWNRVV